MASSAPLSSPLITGPLSETTNWTPPKPSAHVTPMPRPSACLPALDRASCSVRNRVTLTADDTTSAPVLAALWIRTSTSKPVVLLKRATHSFTTSLTTMRSTAGVNASLAICLISVIPWRRASTTTSSARLSTFDGSSAKSSDSISILSAENAIVCKGPSCKSAAIRRCSSSLSAVA